MIAADDTTDEVEDGDAELDLAKKAFERCHDAEKDNRATALEDIEFARLEKQWPDEILTQRMTERRPALTINKLPAFIRQVVNDARQNKPSISVHAVDSFADPKTADVIAGIIRNIEQQSNADVAYDTAAEQAITSGFGYWRIVIDYAYEDAFDLDIKIERIVNQFAVYGDPNSTAADSSDWDECFITDRMPRAAFKRKYKGKADVDFESEGWSACQGTEWLNEDGVLIAEWWRRQEVDKEIVLLSDGRVFSVEDMAKVPEIAVGIESGQLQIKDRRTIKAKKVTQTFMTGAEILETRDHPGCYIPIVPVYGDEILVQGKRYFRSLIHSAIDSQRNFNYWRTAATELVALAPRVPFVGEEGSFDVDPRWQTANSASHPYLEYAKGKTPPQRQPLDVGPAAGVLQEALSASDDMKAIIGMYDASLGARSNETSGKAIMARQREGDVATFHFIDNVTRAIRHTGKILIDLIPKVYTGERIMRVLGEDGSEQKVPVNQQYEEPVRDAEGNATDQTILSLHDLALGKYDITVKSGPSFTSRREEAAMQMTELVRAFPQAAPVIGDLMAKNFDWPDADKVAERLAALNPTNQPQIPPDVQKQIEEGMQELQQVKAENEQLKLSQQAEQAKVQAQTQAKMAEIQAKLQMEREAAQQEYQLEIRKQDQEFQLALRKLAQERQIKQQTQRDAAEIAAYSAKSKAQQEPRRQG